MTFSAVHHVLDLALRLLDTASGQVVGGDSVMLFRDGVRISCLERGGNLILTGLGRSDFTLTVSAAGYESQTLRIRYGALDPNLPYLQIHLIPGPDYCAPVPCLTLEGTLPGITALSAVRAGGSACLIRAFDPRTRILTLFNPHKLELDRVHYALVDPDRGVYEPFSILSRRSDQEFEVDRVWEAGFRNYFPVCPVVLGRTDPGGSYCLWVRDDGAQARWIVRWDAGDGPAFKTVDFRKPETASLP